VKVIVVDSTGSPEERRDYILDQTLFPRAAGAMSAMSNETENSLFCAVNLDTVHFHLIHVDVFKSFQNR
jgi:hypothetical protein